MEYTKQHANELLEEAVKAVVSAYGVIPREAMVMDYLLLVEGRDMPGTHEDPDEDEEYIGLGFPRGNGRKSVALGLMSMADDCLRSGGRVIDEE